MYLIPELSLLFDYCTYTHIKLIILFNYLLVVYYFDIVLCDKIIARYAPVIWDNSILDTNSQA